MHAKRSSTAGRHDLRRRLESRIAREYRTTLEHFQIGEQTLEFLRVTDPDAVLDRVALEEDRREKISGQRHLEPLHLPYWAELWDSSEAIARWIGERPGNFHANISVLDLGCGMGLCGAAAAMMGCDVLLADLEAPALLLAQRNCAAFSPRCRTRKLNWQTDQLGETFNIILGGDILYERKQWDFLEPFWKAHLAPDGHILLGEPGRQTGDAFPDWITARGWRLERCRGMALRREKVIRLFELTRG
jgi:ETFB lysine methyltransferase